MKLSDNVQFSPFFRVIALNNLKSPLFKEPTGHTFAHFSNLLRW